MLAIGILEMTVLGWTVSFILDQVLPRFKLTSLREVTGWQPPTILESRDSDSAQELRSPEPEDPDLTCLPDPSKTQYHPCEAGRSYGPAGGIYRKYLCADWNPWHPFRSAKDFELGWWMLRSGLTKGSIDEYLQRGLDGDRCTSFQTADELWSLFEGVEHGFGSRSWSEFPNESGTLYSRSILDCIRLLLSHLPFADHMAFGPERLFDSTGRRIYNEIHTADWWWETQDLVPRGGTVVPLLFASDKTHLTNFSGDKAAWPVYMSIGNISKDLRRQGSKRAWVLVALMPIPPKHPKDGEIHRSWHGAIERILKPIAELDIAGPGYEWDCADGQVRRCYPILATWIADYQEHVILARIINGLCPVCEIPRTEMGHEPSSRVREFRNRDPMSYQRALERGNPEDAEYLASIGLRGEENPFWRFPLCNVYNLWQPDALHLLHLGILKTMMDWLVGYLRKRKILGRFNERFKSIPPYPGFQPFKRSYEEISSWQGKEIRTMMRFLLAILGPILIDGVRSSESEEARVLACVRSIIEFHLVLGQRSHSDYTLGLLDNRLAIFYRNKSVFRPQRSTKARTNNFEKKWAEMEAKGSEEGWSRRRMEAEKEKLETAIYHFQFPKMHMLSHVSNSIRRMGSPDNFSTDVSELLHRENVKEAYRASNRVQYEEQMLWYNDRHTGIAYMVQTLEHLALSGMYDQDTARVLGMQTRNERLLSTRAARLRGRGPEIRQHAFGTSSRPSRNLAPAISLPIQVPERKQRVDQVIQQTRLAGRARGIKRLSLSEAADRFSIPDLPALFRDYVEELWGQRVAERVLGRRETYAESTMIEIYNSVANYFQPFQRPLEIERRLLRCTKEAGKNEPLSHDIWVRESQDRDRDSFQGRKACKPLLYFSFSPSKAVIPQTSQRNKSPVTETLELVMLVGMKYAMESSNPNRFHGFVEVVLNERDRYVAEVEPIEGPVHLLEGRKIRGNKSWIVNSHIDLETYYYVY